MSFTLITGASSGMGEEFARQYAKKGHQLILTARSEQKLNQLTEELFKAHQVTIHVIPQDLSELKGAEELFNKCQSLNLMVNFIINDAGFGLISNFDMQDLNEIQQMILLNVLSLTKLTYLFLPQIKKNQGAILNLASQVAFNPAVEMAVYAGTKAYVLHFTEALREELKDDHVQVMALCPGPTYTHFFSRAHASPNDINFKFRTPQEVVETAIKGMENNNAITIPGWENKMWVFATHFLPRSWLAKLSKNTVKK